MKGSILRCLVVLICMTAWVEAKSYQLSSPNGKIDVTVNVDKAISYSVDFKGESFLKTSALSLTTDKTGVLGENAKVKEAKTSAVSGSIITPVVKQKTATIVETYNQLELVFEKPFSVIFRVYDDGVAYRFVTRVDGSVKVMAETIEFNFAGDYMCYFPQEDSMYTHQEREYLHKRFSELEKGKFSSIPALVELNGGPKVAVTEADLIDYPGYYLEVQGGNAFKGILPYYPLEENPRGDRDVPVGKRADYLAMTDGTRAFPWRTMIVAEKDGDLILSQMVYKLSSPCEIADTSWIRPGKVAWDWWNAFNVYGVDFRAGVNNDTYKYYIDFASKYGIEYIILDEGWYPLGNLLKTVPEIDMPELIAYGKKKNVDIILWCTSKTLDEQLMPAMEQFSKWGVAGLKVDFMQRDDQKMVQYYEKVAREGAKRHMLIDFHGSYKPAGLRRRFPNVITREGVHGNEQSKWCDHINSTHTTTLPFTRMVAGPMDFTPGAMRNFQPERYNPNHWRPGSMHTRCHEMGMYVIYESPLQMLCDTPTHYWKEPECMEFLGPVPSVWDDSKVIDAKVADYVYLARKNGDDWYIGGMGDESYRDCSFKLDFLDKGATYTLTLFTDGVNADHYAEDYKMVTKDVTANDELMIKLCKNGGFAGRLVKN